MAVRGFIALPLFLITLASYAGQEKDILQRVNAADCTSSPEIDAGELETLAWFEIEMAKSSLLRYMAGDDSFFGDYYTALEQRRFLTGLKYDEKIKLLKAAVSNSEQKNYIRAVRKSIESGQADNIKKFYSKEYPYKDYAISLGYCELKRLGEGVATAALEAVKDTVASSAKALRSANIGHFDVTIKSCSVTDGPITGNNYTEPKNWPGSRFVVIEADFKNLDQEGRLPSEGSLIIKHNGRELRYDSTESILQEGYGIYFKSVNPLITMPTKIVYRIPNEVSGEVSWEPGRNPDNRKLWCTFVAAEQ